MKRNTTRSNNRGQIAIIITRNSAIIIEIQISNLKSLLSQEEEMSILARTNNAIGLWFRAENRMKIIFLRIGRVARKGFHSCQRTQRVSNVISFSSGGWNPWNDILNGTVTGTCPGGQRSRWRTGNRVTGVGMRSSGRIWFWKRVNSPRRSTFAPRI